MQKGRVPAAGKNPLQHYPGLLWDRGDDKSRRLTCSSPTLLLLTLGLWVGPQLEDTGC